MESRHANAKWVAKHYLERFRIHPTLEVPSIIETVIKDFAVNISVGIARRARAESRKINQGDADQQYKLLLSYEEEIRHSNPHSSLFIHIERMPGPVFQRMSMCLAACKRVVVDYGRPVICLDGCHLKGPCPGQLLTAVTMDWDNCFYPLAICVVAVEDRELWEWFLSLLSDDIDSEGGARWTFVSDRQKGLVLALNRVVPYGEHHYCLKHFCFPLQTQWSSCSEGESPMAVLPVIGAYKVPIMCKSANTSISNSRSSLHAVEAEFIRRAVQISDKYVGFTSPHPNFGCVVAAPTGDIAGEGFLYAPGTKSAELLAVEAAGERCRGATAFVNLEPGDCHGDHTAVSSLVQAGITRVVVGMRHPLQHLRGKAIGALRGQGVQVDVLGEDLKSKTIEEARKLCLHVNAPLICRAASRIPFSVLKYAMTLDGKIACSSGHAAWISSKISRNRVLELRGRSDAIIVGGNTVRQDNPRLTARLEGGHSPVRIVMSTSLDLPEEANLWDISDVSTIVATQRGARKSFQKHLASKGVEVIEFDILNPRDVMEYFHDRGYISIFWECGGSLAASAISSGVIHKVFAFVAPKIIGGKYAPTPVGELGMVEMSQALDLIDVKYEQIGPDMLISGFLQPIPDVTPVIPSVDETFAIDPTVTPYESSIIFFYKTWDPYGAFSNFSPHPIQMPDHNGDFDIWLTVEHYYQAQKFVGHTDPMAKECMEKIKFSRSPEEAARTGRLMQRQHRRLVRSDWDNIKIDVMYRALKCKFSIYPHLNSMLLSTSGSVLVEASPHDLFWGGGRDGEGLNYLGRLLMQLRSEFLGESSTVEKSFLSA